MSHALRLVLCLFVACGASVELCAQPAAPGAAATSGLSNAPAAASRSPVEFFRQLLAMTPDQREKSLADRPAENRAGILRKIQEYEKMNPEDRELKLRVTELRWCLPQLMRTQGADRAAILEAVSAPVRKLVEERLRQWDILPPPLQAEVLDHQSTLGYFAGQDFGAMTNSIPLEPPLPPGAREALARLRNLPGPQHDALIASFQKFYDFSPEERQNLLNALSAEQRAQMEKAIQLLGRIPKEQRESCLAAVTKLASLSEAEQQEFLRNAELWREMSPEERQVWRQIANRLPPLPPLPPRPMPPLPPGAGGAGAASEHPLATNNSH